MGKNEARTIPPDEPGLVTHTPGGTIIKHGGSATAYRNYGCRCRACTNANNARIKLRRKERETLTHNGELPTTVAHGKATTYVNWGCRCDACTKAQTTKCNSYYARKLSSSARREANKESWDQGFSTAKNGGTQEANPYRHEQSNPG